VHPSPVAVATGANRGIGLEVCRQLAGRGLTAVLGSRDPGRGEEAARQPAGEGHDVRPRALDVDDDQRAASADLDRVRRAIETNLLGAWRTTSALVPLLRRAEHPRVVNVSSGDGSLAEMEAGLPAHRVTKAALNALNRALAAELRSDRVLLPDDGPTGGFFRDGRPLAW
jgi:NAD(P)-dependent dehydrogenase (short-subunit alcohol dehydrogenase family)